MTTKSKLKPMVVFALVTSFLIGNAGCSPRPHPAGPRLVVLIVVDQFRYDFLERFKGVFGSRGFQRLVDQGAFFTNANYNYVPTFTAPGHAAIATGTTPAQNGIVGNNWFDRQSGQDKVMVSDDQAKLVTSYGVQTSTKSTRPASPRILIGTSIGDQLRLSNNYRSKVVSMSFKDRAAILPGGRNPNGAYWFDASSGSFVSSDYYFRDLPSWASQFNRDHRPDKFFDQVWDRALAPEAYSISQGVTTQVAGSPLGRRFPYKINGGEEQPGEEFYKAFQYTPFASEYLAEFAEAAVDGEALGQGEFPDMLAISFSSTDLVGHAYGPDSEEVEDIYIRLDRVLADLLDYLDRRVGLANTVIAVTGDHGVSPVPQLLALNKIDAGLIDPGKCKDAASQALTVRYGEGNWVLDLVNDQIYLNQKLIADQKIDPGEAQRVAGDAVLMVPGIVNYFTRAQIMTGQMPAGVISTRVTNGFNPVRSGDVWLIIKPFSFLAEGGIATTHGSPYNYDVHVPIILFGPGIRANRYLTECSPTDIAPTLAALLRIEPPSNRTGRVLVEALTGE